MTSIGEITWDDGFTAASAFGKDRNDALDAFTAFVDDFGLEVFEGLAVDRRSGGGWTEDDAGGSVEDAANGPGMVGIGKGDFAGALLFGTVVPAAEEGEVVADFGDVGDGCGLGGESVEDGASAIFGGEGGGGGNWPGGRGGVSRKQVLRLALLAQDDRVWVLQLTALTPDDRFVERDGREHQRLREEGTADGGLFADSTDAECGEALRAGKAAVLKEEDGRFFQLECSVRMVWVGAGCSLLQDDGTEVGDRADELIGESGGGFDALPLLVKSGGLLEVHGFTGCFALGGNFVKHRLAARGEERLHARGFGGVIVGCAGALAGLDALLHFAVGTPRVVGVDLQVFIAAAELEEVEDGIAVALGCGARGEGTECVVERAPAELVSGVDARMLVLHGDAEEVRRVEAQPFACLLRAEGGAGGAVHDQRGFEVGAGAGPLNPPHLFAEVEALREYGPPMLVDGFGWREQTAETAAKIGGAGEVGLGVFGLAAERKDSRSGGDSAQGFVGLGREELDAMLEFERPAHRANCSGSGRAVV